MGRNFSKNPRKRAAASSSDESGNSSEEEEFEVNKSSPVNSIDEKDKKKNGNESSNVDSKSEKPMERQKKRRALDKKRRAESEKPKNFAPMEENVAKVVSLVDSEKNSRKNDFPGLHMDVFGDLASVDSLVREAAAERLVTELTEIQRVYEKLGYSGVQQHEDEKDDGLEGCAPSLRYAIRRLIKGVASSRECARQGFALGLTVLVAVFPSIKVHSLLNLIINLLEFSSSMKGQDARESLLGRLFAYGSLARSGKLATEWIADNKSSCVKDFVGHVVSLAGKRHYLRDPAVAIILDMVDKLPREALRSDVLEAPGLCEWFQKAAETGDPDALFLALKLNERIPFESDKFGKLIPRPFSSEKFFSRDHLLYLAACFKESTLCLPRVHNLWPLLVNMLIPDVASNVSDLSSLSISSKKHKKSKKGSCLEETAMNIRCFYDVVIEESLLLSSHDRKHLALDIILLLLPRLSVSCIDYIVSHKLVQCLMDVLSTQSSLLYNVAQHFLKELKKWALDSDDRRAAIIVSLQKHSGGRFDSITRTQTVKELVSNFTTTEGCLLLVHNMISLFINDAALTDEPSDQSQTTDENSEISSADNDSPGISGNTESLKSWVVNTMPRVLKKLRADSAMKSDDNKSETHGSLGAKFHVQTEIMKFLTVQGLFSASLGNEVTSFELQEKFKWPKSVTSSSLCRMCIEQLQSLLEDAQKGEGSQLLNAYDDLGYYFMCLLNTLCNIPSVSLYRTLSKDDEKAFKKLVATESRLFQEERKTGPGPDGNRLHAMRHLLMQLLLQILLQPGDYSDAALELVICCKKAFPAAFQGDSSEEDDEFDDNGLPKLMDVLLDTMLQLLPHSSSSVCFAIEQVFRFFCDDITEGGLLQMLRIVKKELKPTRHQAASSDPEDDDEEEDVIELEEKEDSDEGESAETGDSDEKATDVEEAAETGDHDDDEISEGESEEASGSGKNADVSDLRTTEKDVAEDSDDLTSSEDYDDEKMLEIDNHIVQMLKTSKSSGSPQTQFMSFKLRVLSLVEVYLQKNPGNSRVLKIYADLARVFVNAQNVEDNKQLRERLGGILKKIYKAKDYPKADDIEVATLENLLAKSLKTASRNRIRTVSSVVQASVFWILKLIKARNLSGSEFARVFEMLQHALLDYFDNKKCRLRPGFFKELIHRHPWVVPSLFGFLVEKCRNTKSEFRRIEALDIVDCMLKSCLPKKRKPETGVDASQTSELLQQHLAALSELIQELLTKLSDKQSRRTEIRRFCNKFLHAISALDMRESFVKALSPDAYSLCEAKLGNLFAPFKKYR